MGKKKKASKVEEVVSEERVYQFRTPIANKEGKYNGGFRLDDVKESELNQEHLDLLYSQLLKAYNESPAKTKIQFIEDAIKMIKENLDKQDESKLIESIAVKEVEDTKELLNDIVTDEDKTNN